MVPEERFELSRLSTLDSKSSVAANYTTPAFGARTEIRTQTPVQAPRLKLGVATYYTILALFFIGAGTRIQIETTYLEGRHAIITSYQHMVS